MTSRRIAPRRVVADVTGTERLPHSRNGNPRWLILTADGHRYATAADDAVGFTVDNILSHASPSHPIRCAIWLARRGVDPTAYRVVDLSPAEGEPLS